MASPLLLDEKALASACSSNRIQDTEENSKEQIRGMHANNGEFKKKKKIASLETHLTIPQRYSASTDRDKRSVGDTIACLKNNILLNLLA